VESWRLAAPGMVRLVCVEICDTRHDGDLRGMETCGGGSGVEKTCGGRGLHSARERNGNGR
jgi:hypothetical protein